ncbi:SusC/RagA family TonB-linked outer membrane protein [Mucilaginibacter sp. E4BP6]|uniref:SusC/RagA family TonB-linked outer membrane protein n=1 Tax=Mucilaginibacter sp. E4BP6 TaxID=2723089 RepID=UPI0015CEB19B|nr:TonB-dependent receptor [Mucilaginibacter sp. E4BP6]NYE66020.1 TonB-linked SusC/RagA family outer membrane protein [Mucilaginibacter sp. E4BP6]
MEKILRKKTRYSIVLFIACMLLGLSSYAQTLRVNGKITNADDSQAISGVTITVKGASRGTVSGVDGSFSIMVQPSDVLVISSLGYVTQQIPVGKNNTINVKLSVTNSSLDEVVVIGYGTSKRKDLTGSIGSVSASDIASTVSTTFDQALQGKIAGVTVTQNSGQPGGGVTIQVRGLGSLNSGTDPLYVIDGVIIQPGQPSSTSGVYMGNAGTDDNPLSTIDPNDIASIDVLKDASAIAIYGSQGSNGVVIVTTKRGKKGQPKLSFDTYYGIQQVPKDLPMMNLQQYAAYINAKDAVTGATPDADFANPKYLGTGTNWQQAIFRNAGMTNNNLSISGGDDRTTYFIAGGYLSQDGTVAGSNFKRTTLKINLDNKTTNWLTIGTNLSFSGIKENVNASVYSLINATLGLTPDIPVTNSDGSIGAIPQAGTPNSYNPNPVAAASLNTNEVQRSQAYGNVYADVLFTKDLKLHNEVTGNFDYGNVNQFYPTFVVDGVLQPINSAAVSATNNKSFTVRNYLSYDNYASNFNVNAIAGHEASNGTYTYLNGGRTGFFANNPQDLDLGTATTATNGGGQSTYATESYMARANVGYMYKYNLTATYRYDYSSNFNPGGEDGQPDNRWIGTYAFGASWNVEKEDFLKNVKSIDQLKFRLSYGLTNNANLPPYTYGSAIGLSTVGLGQGAYPSNIPNSNVKWESSKSLDAGIDLSLFKSRIQFTADVYDRKTNNLLLQDPLNAYAGTSGSGAGTAGEYLAAPWVNAGAVDNRGFELSLNTHNIQGKNFTWNTGLVFSLNRNKVLSLVNDNNALYGRINNDGVVVSRTAVGSSIGDFYGYVAEGVFKNGAELLSSPSQGAIGYANGVWVGDIKYKDLNHDGVIDASDETDLGSPLPKFTYGINNTFSYKAFDLAVFFTGSYGNKILNYNEVLHEDPNSQITGEFESLTNYAHVALINNTGSLSNINDVYVTNPNTTIPGFRESGDPNDNTRISSRFIQSGSYLRLNNLSLGYNIPKNIVAKLHIHSLKVYTNIANVFTITKYDGYDPEIGSNVPNESGYGSNALTQGVDWGRYPTPRIYTFGINLGL